MLLGLISFAPASRAEESSDRIEALNSRAWQKRGSFGMAGFGSYAFNDPMLIRGGGGVRLSWWPRSLVGLSIEAAGGVQGPTNAAKAAQRELKSRLRETGASWNAVSSLELSAADGKAAFGTAIVGFELLLRAGLGVQASEEALRSKPVLASMAALGTRWFLGPRWAFELNLSWRQGSLVRRIDGASVSSRDMVVALEGGVVARLGGVQ